MLWISMVAVVIAVTLLGVVVVRARRTGTGPVDNQAARALREMSRDSRRRRGYPARGSGSLFGRTPINRYGDEHHGDHGGGWGDGGGGGGGDGGGGGGGGSS